MFQPTLLGNYVQFQPWADWFWLQIFFEVRGLNVLQGFSIAPLQSEGKSEVNATSEDANVASVKDLSLSTNVKEEPQTTTSEPLMPDEENEDQQISSSSDEKNKKPGFFTRMAKKVGGGKKPINDAWRPHTTSLASYNNFSASVKKDGDYYSTVQQSNLDPFANKQVSRTFSTLWSLQAVRLQE